MTPDANSTTSRLATEGADAHRLHAAAHHVAARGRTASAWIAGGALWAFGGLLYTADGWRFRAASATFLAADLLLLGAIVGMMLLRPHGASRPARNALAVALAARVVFAAAEVSGLITGTDNAVLLPIAGVLTGVSTIAYGVSARSADRRLRVASAALGLYFFVVMMPFAVAAGEPPAAALAVWGLPAALVGFTLGRRGGPRRPTGQASKAGWRSDSTSGRE